MVDTHCHITHEDYDNIDSLIDDIKKSGVTKIIVNGCDMKSNLEVLDLVKKYDIVYGAIGFHPTELDDVNIQDLEFLKEHINDNKIVAIGEIGLDYHYENTDKDKQILYFKKQLDIALKNKKPVIVHSRDSIQDTYNILKEYDVIGSIHCFSGSVEMAREFIKLGFYIGVGGVITYKNVKNIIDVVKATDMDKILTETDAPYLSPEPKRGEKNSSCNIPIILSKIAEIKNVDYALLNMVTSDNANRLFDI